MDSKTICHPSPAKNMKYSFLDYVQHLMVHQAGRWTRTPYAKPLQPKEWNAHFWIMFNFWWSARLINGLEPHLPPLSSQKHYMLIFGLRSTSDDWPGWSMDSNPICHPSPAKIMKCLFLVYVQLLMISWTGQWTRMPSTTPLQPKTWNACFCITFNIWWSATLVDALEPHLPPLSSEKNEMLIFGLCSTSDDRPGWSMDSNPICHPSPAKNMICSFLGYVQLLMIGRAGQWTQTPSATPLQPKKWNACFWITFNFWWLARLVHGLKPHLPPLSGQKKWNAHFWIMFNFWWSAGLVNGLECHLHHPSPAKNMKCLFLDYIQLLMISQACQCTRTPFATSLQPKEWNAPFWIMFNFWWSARLVNELEPHLPPLSRQKHDMLIFGLRSTSDDWPGWSMDSNPIHHRSPAKKMKCLFLDYIHLLMISQAGRWTRTPSATHLQPKTWNAHFWIMFNFWWSDGLVDGLKPHLQPLCSQKNEMLIFGLRSISDDRPGWLMDLNPIHHPSTSKKMKCLFLDYVQLLMIGRAGRCTQIPSATSLQPKIWNAHFKIMFNFWRLAGLVDGLKPHLPPLSSHKNEMLVFGLRSTSDDWTGLVDGLKPHLPPLSSHNNENAHFWITFNFWWLAGPVDGLKPHLQPK